MTSNGDPSEERRALASHNFVLWARLPLAAELDADLDALVDVLYAALVVYPLCKPESWFVKGGDEAYLKKHQNTNGFKDVFAALRKSRNKTLVKAVRDNASYAKAVILDSMPGKRNKKPNAGTGLTDLVTSLAKKCTGKTENATTKEAIWCAILSVQQKRRVGDSRHTDGALWRVHLEIPMEEDITEEMNSDDNVADEPDEPPASPVISGTQMNRRKAGPRIRKKINAAKVVVDERPEQPEGWIWQLGKLTRMTETEMEEWSSEGDRVQWFGAEAEMQR
ncbi:hypothetical protein B0H14DRAFT_2613749 [Mycena olivaceomarginata]|nr:hypothetical protein B0H14DRAFT_2613749 [Mycena olivaceomarginata]